MQAVVRSVRSTKECFFKFMVSGRQMDGNRVSQSFGTIESSQLYSVKDVEGLEGQKIRSCGAGRMAYPFCRAMA